MDAAHMMLTINRLEAEGVHHFAMVHDSFGVHAADADLLNRVLREEFVRIYSEPVLQKFLDEQRQAHPGVDLPEPPESGNLDIPGHRVTLFLCMTNCRRLMKNTETVPHGGRADRPSLDQTTGLDVIRILLEAGD